MGATCFKSLPEEHVRAEEFMAAEKKRMASEIKLLLLGAGESGKSTIAKQMKIIHKRGYSVAEKFEYTATISENILSSMLTIIYGAQKHGYTLSPEAQADAEGLVHSFPQTNFLEVEHLDNVHRRKLISLWSDPSVRMAFEVYGAKLQLPSSTEYFFNSMDRIFESNYIPDDQDILRARRATTGIHITEFSSNNTNFKCVDVGGQRTERRKWIHVFDDVTAVLFCVGMDEYDLRMREDESIWRIHESLSLFSEIANSTHLSKAAMVLFLNKKDIFKEKIAKQNLTITFPEYAGGKNYTKATEYLTVQFTSLMKQKERLYTHVTNATDTENISFVFDAIRDMLFSNMMNYAL